MVAPAGGTKGLATLKRRSEFLRVRGGRRWACEAFVIETKPRQTASAGGAAADGNAGGPRFGFTVTRKLGSAVVRNRIRRRLREALRLLPRGTARNGWDYVVVARPAVADMPFARLQQLLSTAFGKLDRPPTRRGPGPA
jgi:ribonuclease P protein component